MSHPISTLHIPLVGSAPLSSDRLWTLGKNDTPAQILHVTSRTTSGAEASDVRWGRWVQEGRKRDNDQAARRRLWLVGAVSIALIALAAFFGVWR